MDIVDDLPSSKKESVRDIFRNGRHYKLVPMLTISPQELVDMHVDMQMRERKILNNP